MEKCEKKIFSCSDCEIAIIAGTAAGDPAAVEHLQNCSACREFAEFQKSVLAAEPVINNDIPKFSAVSVSPIL